MTREELIGLMATAMGLEEPNEFWTDCAKAALSAIESSGLAIVPVEPTKEMVSAMDYAIRDSGSLTDYGGWTGASYSFDDDAAQQVHRAMLSANPLKPHE